MLKIKKDNVEQIVTSGSFENLYKSLGYEIVEETKATTVEKAVVAEPEKIEEEIKDEIKEIKKEVKPSFENRKKSNK